MDNRLDPRIPRATLTLQPAALPPLSETHMCLRGDPLLWNHISVAPEDMPGLRSRWWAARTNQIEEASHQLETKFEGAVPGEAQGGGTSRSQG